MSAPRRMPSTPAAPASEARLQQIRREAETHGRVDSTGIRPSGAPFLQASPENGYYGLPVLKAPQWTWEIPVYFFVGGAAGASAVIAGVANLTGADRELVRDARWLAAIGGAISPALLVGDLGMPSRFLNMLRVFKIQSPMSVGSWTLVTFSTTSAMAAFANAVERRDARRNGWRRKPGFISNAAGMLAALSGMVLATYTGVLIGATAIPVWSESVATLPIHFAASGLGAAASILELCGHDTSRSLNILGIGSALCETAIGARIETSQTPALKPLKSGRTGMLTRLGGLLSGPLPLALRLIAAFSTRERSRKLRRAAAVSTIAGSLLTREAWIKAGAVSANDPRIPLQLPPAQL
ncbi:MAG TPA: NrfD/PsrC family molybdoenzyme membrane anchor subunit [Candidatus Angelobacter sp.]|nr:NrfD/PsrC family molybdoenzyme membrane anchor subunit [Candidatus Angelobacter sp.]